LMAMPVASAQTSDVCEEGMPLAVVSKRKSSFENFASAVGLNDKGGSGWEIIAAAAAEPSLEPMEERKGVMCGPASPQIDEPAFEALIKAAQP